MTEIPFKKAPKILYYTFSVPTKAIVQMWQVSACVHSSAYDNCQSSDNFRVKLLCDRPCADLFSENVRSKFASTDNESER